MVHFCVTFGCMAEPRVAGVPLPTERGEGVATTAGILLAEDAGVTQKSGQRWLDKAGYRVVVAWNGQEALERLGAGAFSLVLMDSQMPVMDGVEAARRIRNGEAGPDKAAIPIIAITAYTPWSAIARSFWPPAWTTTRPSPWTWPSWPT